MTRKHYTTTPAQRRANRRYKRKHRRAYQRMARKAACKRFIMKDAQPTELRQVQQWLNEAISEVEHVVLSNKEGGNSVLHER